MESLSFPSTEGLVLTHHPGGRWQKQSTPVAQEASITIYIDQEPLVTILCTPQKLNFLVIGFLYSQGIIESIDDIASIEVCPDESEVMVKLLREHEFSRPLRLTLTSGCGQGAVLSDQSSLPPVASNLTIDPPAILSLMKTMSQSAPLYRLHGGVHASALSDGRRLLILTEDVGRHNTLDKIVGEALSWGIQTRDRLLLTTGRLTSEMVAKAARMAVPILVSRNSPTDRAITLAHSLGITLVGYARGNRFSVYSHHWRILDTAESTLPQLARKQNKL